MFLILCLAALASARPQEAVQNDINNTNPKDADAARIIQKWLTENNPSPSPFGVQANGGQGDDQPNLFLNQFFKPDDLDQSGEPKNLQARSCLSYQPAFSNFASLDGLSCNNALRQQMYYNPAMDFSALNYYPSSFMASAYPNYQNYQTNQLVANQMMQQLYSQQLLNNQFQMNQLYQATNGVIDPFQQLMLNSAAQVGCTTSPAAQMLQFSAALNPNVMGIPANMYRAYPSAYPANLLGLASSMTQPMAYSGGLACPNLAMSNYALRSIRSPDETSTNPGYTTKGRIVKREAKADEAHQSEQAAPPIHEAETHNEELN